MRINRKKFVDILEKVKPGIGKNDLLEQSGLFIFSNGSVSTYNDEVFVSASLDGLDFEGGVDSDSLLSLLRKLDGNEIEIVESDGELRVLCKSSRAGLKLVKEVGEFDFIGMEGLDWVKVTDEFKDALVFASFSCSQDMTLPMLTCVYVNGEFVDSSDNFRATRREIEDVGLGSVLIPAKPTRELARYAGLNEVAIGDGWVFFRFGNELTFSCRVFETDYPEIGYLFELEGVAIEFPRGLIESIDRARIFSKAANLVEFDEHITVTVKKKVVIVRSSGETGWFEESIEAENKIDSSVMFSIHPQFFQEILEKVDKCVVGEDKIKFSGDGWEHVVALVKEVKDLGK